MLHLSIDSIEIGLLVLGLITGILSGFFGIGGGVVLVPTLIAIFGFNILNANAISLTAMLLPVSILGVVAFYKAGYIDIKNALWISLGLLAGSFFGAYFAVNINNTLLTKLYAAFLLYISIDYLDIPSFFKKNKKKSLDDAYPSKVEHVKEHKKEPVWAFILLGVISGVLAGMFGKGGGIVIVPALVKLFRYHPKAAAATSLAALQLPVGLPSVIVYANSGHLNLLYAGLIAIGIVIGAFFGSIVAVKMPTSIFRKVFAVFLFVIAFDIVHKYL
ncbi:MAG: sulfite exporter TauE/SafE family protein [Microbacter sp.]